MREDEDAGVIQLDRPAMELLLVFQRTVQAVIFAEYIKITETQEKEKNKSITQLQDFPSTPSLHGAVALLDKYVDILQAHVMQMLSLSCDVVSTSSCHFSRIASILEHGVAGTDS